MNTYIHKVQYYETDRMGITHHSNYIRWMEEARTDYLEQMGWGYHKLEDLGIISPVVSIESEFKHTTTFHDEVAIRTGIKEFKGVRLVVWYEMTNAETGELVFRGTSSHCFLTKDGKMCRLNREYPEFDAKLKELAAEYEAAEK